MQGAYRDARTVQQLELLLSDIRDEYEKEGRVQVKIERPKKHRTASQNNAMHKFFRLLSMEWNAHGFTIAPIIRLMREEADIPWTDTAVKEVIWKPVQLALTQKKSTRELETHEVTKIYEVVNRWSGTHTGVSMEFPNDDSLPWAS
jgi:hypothetical protein